MPHNTNPLSVCRFPGVVFSLDQIIVFQRILDMSLLRGQIELLMLPCMAFMCLRIPVLRTPTHIYFWLFAMFEANI